MSTFTAKEYAITPPLAGVDTTADEEFPRFALGTVVTVGDSTNSWQKTYRYVSWQAVKTLNLVYEIDSNWDVTDALSTTTDADAPLRLGVFTFTTTDPANNTESGQTTYRYGWIQTAGNFEEVSVLSACQTHAPLYTSGTAGKLDDDASGTFLVQSIKNVESQATSATTKECESTVELYIATGT